MFVEEEQVCVDGVSSQILLKAPELEGCSMRRLPAAAATLASTSGNSLLWRLAGASRVLGCGRPSIGPRIVLSMPSCADGGKAGEPLHLHAEHRMTTTHTLPRSDTDGVRVTLL